MDSCDVFPRDDTHDPAARSWVASAQGHTDFPIQNLPIAQFREREVGPGRVSAFRGGMAIGDQIVDLAALARTRLLPSASQEACELAGASSLNRLMAAGQPAWRALRQGVFELLREDAPTAVQAAVGSCLIAQAQAEYALPGHIGDYTDFYTSIHHARNVGRIIRPDDPLTPNFMWLPIAYHGRASSVVVSGTPFKRPRGQALPPAAKAPVYIPSARLDYELEIGFFIGPGNARGSPIAIAEAEAQIFGLCLLNDWSARDHQFWEMTPLGPFLGKNFCTSVSPWIVMMEAFAPFRCAIAERPSSDPVPLPYLDSAANRVAGGIDVQLAASIDTERTRLAGLAPSEVSRTSFRHQYWTLAQMVTQHTVGGCNLRSGDLIGTGTISGPTPREAGALIELSNGGTAPLELSATGEQRTFLEDGDAVILRGWCEAPGAVRIGFGTCEGLVLPAS
jgi:fumarylacetoacetase